MSKRLGAAFVFVVLAGIFLAAKSAQGGPTATPANLVACPWFREFVPPQGTIVSVCGHWTRDNNVNVLQASGVPSPDSMDGTAQRFQRDYCCLDESKLWQIVESPGGLRLHFSVFHQIPAQGDLLIRIYGRDTRYGVGGWALLWTPVDETGGNNVWQYVEKELTLQRPYNYYMIEIIGHVPLPIGTTGAALTGVHLSVDGSTIYLPTVIGGGQ